MNCTKISPDIKDINYVSEGFLGRYYYTIEEKKENLWKKLAIGIGAVIAIVAAVVATVFTCGAAGAVIGAGLAVGLSAGIAAGGAAVGAAIGGIAIAGAVAVGVTAVSVGIEAGVLKARQARNKEEALAVDGRNDPIPEGYERKEKEESR